MCRAMRLLQAEPIAFQYVADLASRNGNCVIDDLVAVVVGHGEFLLRDVQPPLDGRFRFRAALSQTTLQFRQAAAVDENGDRLRILLKTAIAPSTSISKTIHFPSQGQRSRYGSACRTSLLARRLLCIRGNRPAIAAG